VSIMTARMGDERNCRIAMTTAGKASGMARVFATYRENGGGHEEMR
jgi:hypothetical protein